MSPGAARFHAASSAARRRDHALQIGVRFSLDHGALGLLDAQRPRLDLIKVHICRELSTKVA